MEMQEMLEEIKGYMEECIEVNDNTAFPLGREVMSKARELLDKIPPPMLEMLRNMLYP